MEKPSLELVAQALGALYHDPDAKSKEQASTFLNQLQKSPFAWEVADQLLHQLSADTNVSYFAAHTMRTKVYYNYKELPADSRVSLRDSLLGHLTRFGSASQPVVTQLALAVADLAVQMVEWKDAVENLISQLAQDRSNMPMLLETLTLFPEEVESPQFKLGSNRRREVAEEMRKSGSTVLSLLSTCYETFHADLNVTVKIFRCLASWMCLEAFPMQSLVNSHLMLMPFQHLTVSDVDCQLQEAAADSICSSLYICENSPNNVALAQFLQPHVYSLFPSYQQAVADEDTDRAINFCRIFTEMAESFIDYLIYSPNESLGSFNTLTLVLECVKHTDYEVAEKTYNFWYRLSERLYQRDDMKFWDLFKPHVEALIEALRGQCRFDDDRQDIPDSQDDFIEFRHHTIELVYDIVFAVGSLTCFKKLFSLISGSQVAWPDVEATLYVMQAIAKRINTACDDDIINQVMQAIVVLPVESHVLLHHSALKLVGQLSDWLNTHSDLLEAVLGYLVRALKMPQLASEAAFALDHLCQGCKQKLGQHFDGLLQIVAAADSLKMTKSAIVGLLRGACEVLSLLPAEKVTVHMQQLCSLASIPLQELVSLRKKKQEGGVSIIDCLDRLAAIFRHTTPVVEDGATSHPCQSVIEQLWPMLSSCCGCFTDDAKIMERWCRTVKYGLRCLHSHSSGLIGSLANQMVTVYAMQPHSSLLYLASILVDEYGKDPACIQGLIDMLQAFCPIAFKLLAEDDGLVHNPDTVDDLFRLCSRFLQHAALPFLQSSVILNIMECALASLTLHHREAHASVCKFIYELLRSRNNKFKSSDEQDTLLTQIQKTLGEFGSTIVCQVITGCASLLPSYTFVDLGDILWEMRCYSPHVLSDWVKSALVQLLADDSKPGAIIRATEGQLLEFHGMVINAKEQQDVWDAMRYLASLYN
ncbi:transportin-3-like [Corticium candelabrum]|uniref:transportin-3-like n=1 Tax=Corticium candelabrum TaxID=121492 RepID=UPI002E270598|nr:transportin-3-like [Corticium candelabrum]